MKGFENYLCAVGKHSFFGAITFNGQRYDSVCGNGLPAVVARVFACHFQVTPFLSNR